MNYKPFSNFIFRTPSLPYNKLSLDSLEKNKVIEEAIYIASPILYTELQKMKNGEIKNEVEKERILLSLSRYISRMSTRCTPFGLFAGCGIGIIREETSIILDNSITRVTRLDNYLLSSLYDTLTKIPEIRKNLKYYPNTSLYRTGNKYRFIEIIYTQAGRRYQITEVEYSNYLNKILKTAQTGETVKKLAKILVSKDISLKDAEEFIEELIESQVIVPELNQTVIGDDFFRRIISLLASIENIDSTLLEKVKRIDEILNQLDSEKNAQHLYRQIIDIIKELNIPYEEKHLFQVDIVRNTASAILSNEMIDELKSAITFLNKITPSFRNEKLKEFQERFYNRYEDQEVPLFEVLDPEIGLGYPSMDGTLSPLIDDLVLPQNTQQSTGNRKLHSLLFQKTAELPNRNKLEIEFSDKDVEGLSANWDNLPPTISVMFEIVQADSDNTLIKLQSCGGSSAANLIARFAHTDNMIAQFVKDITTKEQELTSDAILAEIVHSPEARTGNILFRPHIREYELLFMSDSDLPREQIILLSDLLLSVRNGRLILRSKRLNKEIIPRLTSAHNYYYYGTTSIYRFLADMQVQTGRGSLYFNWGQELESKLPFLPRVRYKNAILSLATWTVKIDEIKHLFKIQEEKQLLEEIEIWREKRFLPQYTLMQDGDNELFVDWYNLVCIHSLFAIIKKRQEIKFTEFLFNPDTATIRDANSKAYTNECIVAFYKDNN
ncbi:MAG: lantibiotic dehydratase family protein [Dysgonomonas sp.]